VIFKIAYGIGAKVSALSNAFANENYYFTTAQTKATDTISKCGEQQA
jgi:hypothetical protein